MFRRPYIRRQGLEVLAALALIAGGFVLLHDAYEGRGLTPPWPFRALSPY